MSEPPALAPPREASTYTVAMVCLGNICRSPTAQVVLSAKLAAAGLADRVTVLSAGTGDWHVGDRMDQRAAATLSRAGYDPSIHRAQQFDASWFDRADVIFAMDHGNRRTVAALAGDDDTRDRIRMLREFDPEAGDDLEVPDPWYGGQADFDEVLGIVERSTDRVVERIRHLL